MSATRRSWEFDDVCMAIRTSFPGCPPDRRSHGWRNLKTRSRTKPHDHVEFGDDAEVESETEAIVGAQESLEESDANEVLATWKQARTATAQEKLNRGREMTLVYLELPAISDVPSAHESHLEKLMKRGTVETPHTGTE